MSSPEMMTPIKKTQPLPPSTPVDPSAAFAQNPNMNPNVVGPESIPIPTGPSQGQERFMQPRSNSSNSSNELLKDRFSFMNKDMFKFKDFDLKTLLIVFLITAVVSSSLFVLALRRFVPNAINSDGLLTPVASVLVGIFGSILYLSLIYLKNMYVK
jgi:hypothetical protein